MRILIYGAGKTGTTAVYYAYRDALPGITCVFEPPGLAKVEPAKHRDLLVKSLAVGKHVQDAPFIAQFDKKILIVRHPFDRLVSYVLYSPHAGYGFYDDRNMENYLALLRKKLANPSSVSFRLIFDLVNEYRPSPGPHLPVHALEAIADSYPDFHLLRYEDFVDGKLDALNRYNGFAVANNPKISGVNESVVRSKDYGDWRKWFLPEDVAFFRDEYAAYLERFGYDAMLQPAEPLDETTTIAYGIKVANQSRAVRGLPAYVPGQIGMTGEGLKYQQARRAFRDGRVAQAERLVNEVLASNRNIAGVYELQSQILSARNDLTAAVEALQRAIALNPKEPKYYRSLGKMFRQLGRKREAAAAVQAARALKDKAAA